MAESLEAAVQHPVKGKHRRRPRGRPKLKDIARLEGSLLAVALGEFMQHGYGGASMARIVRTASVSKTTLYSRFPSKEDLFRAILREQIERASATRILNWNVRSPKLREGLESYGNSRIELSLTGDLLEVNRLIYSEARRFPELGAASAERTEMGIQEVAEFIRRCASADRIPCKDPESVAEVFIFMLRGWYENVMLTGRKVSKIERESWVARAVGVLLKGRAQW